MVKETVFKDVCIQKGYRVKVPKAIVDTLGIKEGDAIELLFDSINEKITILIKKRGK